MNLDRLAGASGEWLKGTGPESDIVISSRIRLARNAAGRPFLTRASADERREIEATLRAILLKTLADQGVRYLDLSEVSELQAQLLVERHLISRELAQAEGPRGVAFSDTEAVAAMVNEEDHLRLQVLRSGLALGDCWAAIDPLDDRIGQEVPYAFSPTLGFLTACPTNVGTGLRASVMLHLPGLVWTGQMGKVFESVQRMGLAVRGLYGEGTQASGDFFQISNQRSLGQPEPEIIAGLEGVVPRIIRYERRARQALLTQSRIQLHDRVSRALGQLRSSRTITSEETLLLLSAVRLGVNLRLIEGLSMSRVNELFILTQPAHLQTINHQVLDREKRNVARADFIRSRLNGG